MRYDVLTMGEALLRLTPPQHRLFSQTNQIDLFIGGSELNTAVGLARLGKQVAWLSRLTDHTIGRLIERTLIEHRVDHSHIIWTDQDRIGTYYMEEGKPPRTSDVIYDRAHSSMARIKEDMLDVEPLRQLNPTILHLTGITMALSESCARAVHKLLQAFEDSDTLLSFDFNYRAKLWQPAQAKAVCEPIMSQADVIFLPERDAQAIYGTHKLETIHLQYPQAIIVMTKGMKGASVIDTEGVIFQQPIYPAETVCRVGGGDAFSAGFLYALLQKRTLQECLQYGSAVASLKYSLSGDLPLVTLPQVEGLIRSHRDPTHNSISR